MWICPECGAPEPGSSCPACGLAAEVVSGVADWRPRAERALAPASFDPDAAGEAPESFDALVGPVEGLVAGEVGAGDPRLARRLRARGAASVIAVGGDPAALAALAGEAGIEPIVASLESLPFRDHFDVLVCRGALERVVNVASLLHSLNRALRVGGRLVVRSAYCADWMRWAPGGAAAAAPPPLRTVDRGVLCELVTSAAFAVEEVREDGVSVAAPGIAAPWRSPRRRSGARPRIIALAARKQASFA